MSKVKFGTLLDRLASLLAIARALPANMCHPEVPVNGCNLRWVVKGIADETIKEYGTVQYNQVILTAPCRPHLFSFLLS